MTDNKKELLLRAEAKIQKLKSNLADIKVDAKASSNEEQEKLEKQISEMKTTIQKAGDNFSETVAKKINNWLK